MTRLRKMMLEELERRNYAETTTRHYLRTVEDFARRFNRPPDRLGRDTFANIKRSYFRSGNCRRIRSRDIWRLSDSSTSRLCLPKIRSAQGSKLFFQTNRKGRWACGPCLNLVNQIRCDAHVREHSSD